MAAAAEAVRNATNVVKSVTLLATVLKVATVEEVEAIAVEEAMAEGTEEVEGVAPSRLATPAAAMDICHATVPRVRNATTVSRYGCG